MLLCIHTLATTLHLQDADSGAFTDISHSVIKRLANHHSNTDITTSYVIIDPERLREPMDKIGNEFVRLMGADIDDLVIWRCANLKQIQTNQLRLGVTVKPLES